MNGNRFRDRLRVGWSAARYICIGLDPDEERIRRAIPHGEIADAVFAFNSAIVDATKDIVLAYKPNAAFYEQFGPPGMLALQRTVAHIHRVAPEVVVIIDGKRGDIEHTNAAYARALFDAFDADAITVLQVPRAPVAVDRADPRHQLARHRGAQPRELFGAE